MEAQPPGDSLVQRAYQHVWQGILSGRLRPGAVLSEAALARSLGISRTPVGEAIRRLADEGLLEQMPRFGTVVRSIAPDEVAELCELQEALESLAAARAAGRASAGVLSRMAGVCDLVDRILAGLRKANVDMLTEVPLRRFLAADLAFHTLVAGAGGNRRLLRTVRELGIVQIVFWLRVGRQDTAAARKIQQGHRRILAALRDGDAEAARREMAEHVRLGRLQTLEPRHGEGLSEGEEALRGLPHSILAELDGLERIADLPSAGGERDEDVF